MTMTGWIRNLFLHKDRARETQAAEQNLHASLAQVNATMTNFERAMKRVSEDLTNA